MASGDLNIEEKASDDLATQVDREINAVLLDPMQQRFPKDGFVTEELPPDEGVVSAFGSLIRSMAPTTTLSATDNMP